MDITQLLKLTIQKGASDLHLITDYFPTVRVNGELLQQKTLQIIDYKTMENLLFPLLTQEQKENLMVNREIDFGYNFELYRFRINMYYSRNVLGASFRLIPNQIKSIEELGLPQSIHKLTELRQGLVLITGPTGEGKSTTIASIINEINMKRSVHILTIEDPIEYVYPKGRSIISQREIGQDSHSWRLSLRSALREDPDIVLVGEMRDYETIQAALTIAETGHLVFSSLHTNSTSQTIDRIIDVFPADQQPQVKVQLSSILTAVISQRLVPDFNNFSRLAVCEILMANPAVSSLIREGKTHLIDNVIQTSSQEGMVLLEKSLYNLYKSGKISKDVALTYAIRQNDIKKMIAM
jgi:twitching motility protein PilT